MAILSKVYTPDNFESHNSLKLSFTNTRGLRSNFADCESFLESNSPDILALYQTNLDDSVDSGSFSVRGFTDRIARAFNRSGATPAVALDISKAFDSVWCAGLLHKLKSYGTSGQIFGLISSFFSNRQLQVVLDGKSSQEYPVNAGVPQVSILGPTLFL